MLSRPGRCAVACAALLGALAVSGCGAGEPEKETPPAGSIQAHLDRPGQDVALTPGTSGYVPGPIRVTFLVIRHDGSVVERPTAKVWIAKDLRARPYATGLAHLQPIGVPGRSAKAAGEVSRIYVTHLSAPRPGKYWLLAEPVGARRPVQAVGNVIVTAATPEPGIGEKAVPSQTPTLSSGKSLAKLTTATPPDRGLLRHSIAGSIAAHVPFVVTFATPKFCTSRTCGPVVDVVDAARKRFTRTPVRFIHVEIYADNDPSAGFNRWVKEWRLPTEPWTFLVGADGRVKAKFEGSLSVAELAAAVRSHLVAR